MIALVLGGADCVWADADAFHEMVYDADEQIGAIIAVNDIGAYWKGPLHYWCSLHPEKMGDWEALRAQRGLSHGYITVSQKNSRNGKWKPDKIIKDDWGGSSGLLALRIAKDIVLADRIVLAGVPLEANPHFFDPKPWAHFTAHRSAWSGRFKLFADKTRSMSGWTRKHLGAPTPEWLRRIPDKPMAVKTGEGDAS
jgi:hypothetical protein